MGRRVHPAWGALLVAAGLVVLGWAGLEAGQYMPEWGEADPRCIRVGECTPAGVAGTLRSLWWVVAVAASAVLLGVAVLARVLSSVPRGLSRRTLLPGMHAVVAGLTGGLVAAVFAVPALVGFFLSPHAVVGAALAIWLVPAAAVAVVDQLTGSPGSSPRRAWLAGLAISPLAAVGAGLLLSTGAASFLVHLSGGVFLAYGAVVALLVFADRSREEPWAVGGPAAAPAYPPTSAPRRPTDPARVLVAVLAVLSVLAVVGGLRSLAEPGNSFWAFPDRSALPSTPVVPLPEPQPPPQPQPVPEPPPAAPPPVVEASVPCAPEDLSFAVPAFDAAMGARASNLQATNVGPVPCWVEGVPVVTLLQGGRPLSLTVEPGQTPAGEPATVQRVHLAPGGSAFAFLTWRTYTGWADAETPQTVTVALDPESPAQEAAVNADHGPAPFDIADGGTWEIAPWAPPPWED